MDSKEAMRRACENVGIKTVAESLGLSQTAIYNQINDEHRKDILAKFVDFVNACGDDSPMVWACEQLNGMFIRNPEVTVDRFQNANQCVSDTLREFSDVIKEISIALQDNKVTRDEADRIRKEWEELKLLLESFVLACEFGYLNKNA